MDGIPVQRPKPSGMQTAVMVLLAVLFGASLILLPNIGHEEFFLRHRLWLWLGYGILLILFGVLAGKFYTEQGWKSALIDENNMLSLSLVQFGLWSLLLFSTVPIALTVNQLVGVQAPWSIEIPNELLIASGISLATLVAARLVAADGATETPDPTMLDGKGWKAPDGSDPSVAIAAGAATQFVNSLDSTPDGNSVWEFTNEGVNVKRISAKTASFADLVMGTGVNGVARLDLARVQMLMLTLTLVGVYSAQVWQAVDKAAPASEDGAAAIGVVFPGMTTELIALLVISSAGYVGGKQLDIFRSKV